MKRRTKNKKEKPLKTFWRAEKGTGKRKSARSGSRFAASVVVMIAFLSTAVLLLLVSLIRGQSARATDGKMKIFSSAANTAGYAKSPQSETLSDGNLDFRITLPAGWKGWTYKTGFVKSPVDDELSDQYVQIYMPDQKKTASRNLDERQTKILMILKFTEEEWKKLETGCGKNNLIFCGAMGKKLAENKGAVYSYLTGGNCPGPLEAKCREADKIAESFQLK